MSGFNLAATSKEDQDKVAIDLVASGVAYTRSHEYARLASYAENNSANINQNYSQEFVGYVTSQRPGEADQLLSDTASPEVRAERERLVQAFVEERIKPQLLQQFEQNKGRTGDGIGNVSAPTVASDLKGEYREQQADMENSAAQHGVKAEGVVATDVQNQRSNVESQVNDEKNTVISSGESSGKEYRDLQNEHDQGKKAFDDAQKAENERQKFYKNDFVISHDENIKQIKNDMSNRFNGKT